MSAPPSAIADRLARAERLLDSLRGAVPSRLEDAPDLHREALRIRPVLEDLTGRAYGRLPHVGFRGRLEARFAGPWSQYLTLGLWGTRVVRLAPAAARLAVPTLLAHELAHRYAFDETVTTLRGLEASARLADSGDRAHQVSAKLELARLLLGAAMADSLAQPETAAALEAFFRDHLEPELARARSQWRRLRGAARADWASAVYAQLPLAALEGAAQRADACSAPPPFPRFPLDGLHAAVCATYTGVDAITGRRRAGVPLQATLALWRSVGPASSPQGADGLPTA